MKLKFETSKTANFFFFVSNLSEWHFSCRPSYNEKWLKMTGKITTEEEKALEAFKTILQKYGFYLDKKGETKYLGQLFMTAKSLKSALEALGKKVLKNELGDVEKAFSVFKERFEKVWDYYDKKNKKSYEQLRERVRRINYQMLFSDVEKIFYGKELNQEVSVIVLYSPLGNENTAAGGANLEGNRITLELPTLRNGSWQQIYSIMVLAHEIAHLVFEKRQGRKLLDDQRKKMGLPEKIDGFPMHTVSFLNEIITNSFLPKGYLGQKYSNFKLSPMLLDNINKGLDAKEEFRRNGDTTLRNLYEYFIWQLYPLAVNYGRRKKQIDIAYVEKAGETVKELIKKIG